MQNFIKQKFLFFLCGLLLNIGLIEIFHHHFSFADQERNDLKNLSESARLVNIQNVNPHIELDIRYATKNNFTGQKLYSEASCYLRESVAEELDQIELELEQKGYRLKVFDCYRPLSVQKKMWELIHDERYVADPSKGSRHNRGAAVDLTILTLDGQELDMGTSYDDFTEKASPNYQNLSKEILKNRKFLKEILEKHGFKQYPTEWWHFDKDGWEVYEILDKDFSDLKRS